MGNFLVTILAIVFFGFVLFCMGYVMINIASSIKGRKSIKVVDVVKPVKQIVEKSVTNIVNGGKDVLVHSVKHISKRKNVTRYFVKKGKRGEKDKVLKAQVLGDKPYDVDDKYIKQMKNKLKKEEKEKKIRRKAEDKIEESSTASQGEDETINVF